MNNNKKELKNAIDIFVLALQKYCGIDKSDSNIMETADRLYRMYTKELLVGYTDNQDKNFKLFLSESENNEIVIDCIPVKSLCIHHLLPFYGSAKITIKYKKDAKVLGLSKYYRIVDHFSRKLQLQEKLTNEIANYLYDKLETNYVKVEINATHTCVGLRGVNSLNNNTYTCCIKE